MASKISRLHPTAVDLQRIIGRGLNCLDPQKAPQWALDLSDELLPTDKVEIIVTREPVAEDTKPSLGGTDDSPQESQESTGVRPLSTEAAS